MDLPHAVVRGPVDGRRMRDPSRMVIGAVGLLVVVVLVATAAAVWSNLRDLGEHVVAEDLETVTALAEALSALPADQRARHLPEPTEHRAFALVDPDGVATPAGLGAGGIDARWQRWSVRVAREAELTQKFSTRDPEGTQWRYVTVPMADGSTLLLGRRGVFQSPVQNAAVRALLAGVLAVGLIGAVVWPLVRRGFLRPLDELIEASEDLRWRGDARRLDRGRVDRLTLRGDHIGRLAGSLQTVDQDVSRHFLQMSTLLETIQTVAGSLDTSEVFRRILWQLHRLFAVEGVPVQGCAVLSLDERANLFQVRASIGLSDAFVRQLRVDPADPNSPSIRSLELGEPIQISDTDADLSYTAFRDRAAREGYRCVLAIPLATAMAPPSVLLVYRSDPYRYSHSELELATSFGQFASMAMENAELYSRIDDRLQEQTQRLEAIIESLDDGFILAGLDGLVSYHNTAATVMLNTEGQRLAGRPVAELLARLGGEPLHLGSEVGTTSREVSATVAGQPRELRLRAFTVVDEHGAGIGHGYLWQDITQERFVHRLKSSLLTTASHELRRPLANIKGYVSTLLADDVEWDRLDQQQFLMTISSETDRLTALVRDLLDMSRIEAGMLAISREQMAVEDVLERAVSGFGSTDHQRLRLDVADDMPVVELDSARIETAVRNLVDNALKFSPASEPVTISARCIDGELLITVRDRGPGIPGELHDQIFDSFVRGDDGLARQVSGFGLGLAISRGFVEAHGGRIWCRPDEPGTSFVLAIPVGDRVKV